MPRYKLSPEERAAEKERKENLSKERKARAAEIEDLIKQRVELDKQRAELDKTINEKVDAFADDYGYFHCTIKNSNDLPVSRSWFDDFFDHIKDENLLDIFGGGP
mgnify:CR=1 FL=1